MKVSFLHIMLFSMVIVSGCKKKETTPEPAPVTPPVQQFGESTAEYVKFTLNDSSYSYSPPAQGTWASGSPPQILSGSPPDPNRASFYRSYYDPNTIIFSFSKTDSTRQAPNTTVSNDFTKDAFKTGTYPYTSSSYTSPQNLGVSLSFRDKNGQYWNTSKSSGSSYQNGATFKIEQSASYMNGSFFVIKIKGVFNCKVYNASNGDSTQITNGEAIISFFK